MRLLLVLVFAGLLCGCGATGLPKSGHAVVSLVTQAEYTNNDVRESKTGTACSVNILGIVATGDATVETAKRQGGITRVYTIDRDIFGLHIYFPIYAKSCTIIRGT